MAGHFRILATETFSTGWTTVKTVHFDLRRSNGDWQHMDRDIVDRGHGVAVLLYNRERRTVILTRQFRMAVHLGNGGIGFLLEVPGGMTGPEGPDDSAQREAQEETGYAIAHLQKVFEAFSSPGSLTEKFHYYIAQYQPDERASQGGGLHHEGEDIEVVELPFQEAFGMIATGGIEDARTILLLQHAMISRLFGN